MGRLPRTGRPREEEYWGRVTVLEGGRRVKCNDCGYEFAASANRIKSHIDKVKGKGIRVCTAKSNSNNYLEHNLLNSQGHIQDDAENQKRIQVGSSFVSNGENVNLHMMKQYVLECLRPEDKVFISPLSYLTQEEFITLKPEAHLDSLVIDIFVEILTNIERKKKTLPSNWYLPVTFSNAALKGKVGHFLNFVHCQKMKENYMSDLGSCEKIFIPVHIGARPDDGHFYLYIIHLKNEEIEIWDSLSNTIVPEIEREATTKLLFAMEKLFEEVAFTKFHSKKVDDLLLQPNGFDCGVFVINYMKESNNYVKRNSLFQFDSNKEREDLALKLLNSDLNQEKQNLYDRALRHYAQVEKQNGSKRLRVDASKTYIEDVIGSEVEAEYDSLRKGSSKGYILPTTELIGYNFQGYIKQIWEWIMDDNVSSIGIWGIGGSGKTALAAHIHNKLIFEEASSDSKVIWATVSQNYSISHLQKVIARSIELDISDEFEVRRIAGKLLQAFKVMKKCVIILDDVWDHLFLNEVGFPISENRIKLILTTRIWDVCQGMDCEKNTIKVKYLYKKGSWALFKKITKSEGGLSDEAEDIAEYLGNQCNGLPLAIVRIATGMKEKTQAKRWSDILECLENLGNGQYEIGKWILPVLRSSYDFLNNKLQKFFLYCALSTDEYYFNEKICNRLIRRFVYASLDETKKLRVQYNEGINMLDKLKDHSMLEESCKKWWRMNKFLRDLAIGIAEDTGKILANAYKHLTEIPSHDRWKDDLEKVFLTGNVIQTIPDGTSPRCSQLSTLILNRNAELNYISDDFFNNMPALKTLDLSDTGIKRLPESVSGLECLVALLLSSCRELSYIPSLRNLRRLISLDLSFTAITQAPMGLESLVNLRYLNLLRTRIFVMSASHISELINLEHLGLSVTAPGIQGLSKLEIMVAHFRNISIFNTFVSFLGRYCLLRSYHLIVWDARRYFSYDNDIISREYYSVKRITFVDMDLGNINADPTIDLKELCIRRCHQGTGARSLCNSIVSFSDCQFELLDIQFCSNVEYLCCLSGSCSFCSCPLLVRRLSLEGLIKLKGLVTPNALVPSHESTLFSDLTHLSVGQCHSMETLMTPKLLALLQNIISISVGHCYVMKEIIVGEHDSETEYTDIGLLTALLPEDFSHPPITLPKLTSLELKNMPQLSYVYRGVLLCPSLQIFKALSCEQLKHPRIKISSDGCVLHMENVSSGYRWKHKSG